MPSLTTTTSFVLLLTSVLAAPQFHGKVLPRAPPTDATYDYIVIGGGTSGLTVANRLSENYKVTVLVIEAGPLLTGDREFEELLIPQRLGTTGKRYDWNYTAVPNPILNNRASGISTSRIVGGGTALNGMFFDRGAKPDYDSWERLGSPGWGWKGLLPYFRKSETFHPMTGAKAEEFGFEFDPKAHGFKGPVHASFPDYTPSWYKLWIETYKAFGIGIPKDGGAGTAVGVFYVPSSVDPRTATRSYARTAHYGEKQQERENLELLTENTVTRILFEKVRGKAKAVGVEYATGSDAERKVANARKGVVLAAGAVKSPGILEISGIGDKRLLESVGVETVVDLPGVGANFQDHPGVALSYSYSYPPSDRFNEHRTNATYAAEMFDLYMRERKGPYGFATGNLVGFISLPDTSSNYKTLLSKGLSIPAESYLPNNTHPDVIRGYKKQVKDIASQLSRKDAAVQEQLWGNTILAKPFSRGNIHITTNDPFAAPRIDFRAFSHPLDITLLMESLRWFRKIAASPVAQTTIKPVESTNTKNIVTDEDFLAFIKRSASSTLAHPVGTTALGKREDGGVVDAKLRVYGTEGLWVVDAGLMTTIPGTHTSATVYAVAEKAADLIKTQNK